MTEREAWLEWRRLGIGSSDVAAILGVSPWRTEWDTWADKVYPQPDETDAAKTRGHRLEVSILTWMADEIGVDRWVGGEGVVGPEPWMRATPDGLGYRGTPDSHGYWSDPYCGLEAKSSRDRPWSEPPIAYELQCRWLQAVMGIDLWFLGGFFVHHDEWRIWRIDRDLELEAALVGRLHAWWVKHVEGDTPPPLDGSAAAHNWLRGQHSEAGAEWATGDAAARDLATEHANLGRQISRLKGRRDAVSNELRASIGDAAGIRGDDWRCRWSRFERKRLDMDGLRADHPELLDSYTETVPADRLTVTLQED